MGKTDERLMLGKQAHAVDLFLRPGDFEGDYSLVNHDERRIFGGTLSECLIYLRGRKDGIEYAKVEKL